MVNLVISITFYYHWHKIALFVVLSTDVALRKTEIYSQQIYEYLYITVNWRLISQQTYQCID
jgi:hypothetical protein